MAQLPSSNEALSLQGINMQSLRTLDDFALGSARFQMPNLQDYEKWGNRVVKNLLYYQTNYFLIFLFIYVVMFGMNPVKIMSGLIVMAALIAIYLQFFRQNKRTKGVFVASRSDATTLNQKWYILAGGLLLGYFVLHLLNAVLLTVFTLLLPFSLVFIHASLRMRNIKNKVVNTMESFGPSTPMGIILDEFNIKADA